MTAMTVMKCHVYETLDGSTQNQATMMLKAHATACQNVPMGLAFGRKHQPYLNVP